MPPRGTTTASIQAEARAAASDRATASVNERVSPASSDAAVAGVASGRVLCFGGSVLDVVLTRRRRPASRRDLSDHAFDQVVHLLQVDVFLRLDRTGGDHDLAGVVLDGARIDDERSVGELGLGVVG